MNTTDDLITNMALPSNIDAERAILGALLLGSSVVPQAREILRLEDFFLESHRIIYDRMLAVNNRAEPIDLITLSEELQIRGELINVGGVTYLASLIDGVPRTDDISPYARILKNKAKARRLIRMANGIVSRVYDEQDNLDAILQYTEDEITDLNEELYPCRLPLIRSFADFMKEQHSDSELIAFDARRHELVLLAAITNRGKSTLLRNALLKLSCGGTFFPLVPAGPARKVLLLDFETSRSRLQADLDRMTNGWSERELEFVRQNLFVMCEPMIGNDILSLSTHIPMIENYARDLKVDLIVVDTASAAFDIYNENDNGEVGRRALKPLLRLARNLNCVVVLAHHIGKTGSEESRQADKAYRSRGASAWGCWPTSVFNLTINPNNADRVTLTCAKRKNGPEYDAILELNRATRWFRVVDDAPAKTLSTREIIRAAITHPMKKAEIVAALEKQEIPESTIEKSLKRDVEDGYLESPRRGLYRPKESAGSASQYGGGGNGGIINSK